MSKLYLGLILLFAFRSSCLHAQVSGDTCSNPLIARLCDSATITVATDSFKNTVSSWDTGIIFSPGPDVFYQINLPSTPYPPDLIHAVFTGHYTANKKKSEIYFFWFEDSLCSTFPLKIDSFPIKSASYEFPDSFIISYPITKPQSSYYLAVDFKDTLSHPDSAHNLNYMFTIHFGFTNTGPNDSCKANKKPYVGILQLDKSVCYSQSNPYNLPLAALGDSLNIPNLILPSTDSQKVNYIPINDQYANGFVLDLKRNIVDSSQKQQVFIAYDNFPYFFSPNGDYVVGITLFMKNKTGTAGLKGFRIQIPGATMVKKTAIPADSTRGFYNYADTLSRWRVRIDSDTTVCTWVYDTRTGRGDNIQSDYGCEVYTFSVRVHNLDTLIKAWYLSDNYGVDSLTCERTDCAYGDYGEELPQWIQIDGPGNLGGNGGITGTPNCSNNISTCTLANYLEPCNIYVKNSNCPAGTTLSDPYVQYYDDGCYETIYGTTIQLYSLDFTQIADSSTVYDTICAGTSYALNISGSPQFTATVIYTDSLGNDYPVDAAGNIEYGIEYDNLVNSINANLSRLPVYPPAPFSIPLTVAGTYSMRGAYQVPDTNITYVETCYGTLYLSIRKKPNVVTTVTDDTICQGNRTSIMADSATTYQWLPDTTIIGSTNGQEIVVKPSVTTTYTVAGINSRGCVDTTTAIANVKVCPPIAYFYFSDSVCAGQPESFTDTSEHVPTSWQWTFSGGSPATYSGQSPPSVYYDSADAYKVKLVVSNSAGKDSLTKTIFVKDCGPKAKIGTVFAFCATDSVVFIDSSSANTTGWVWSFPDGTPSSYIGKNPPPVFYNDSGAYTAMLVASNFYGKDTAYGTFFVNNCIPKSKFLIDIQYGSCVPECFYFANLSSANTTSWQWSFHGGTPSSFNGQNPPEVCYDTIGIDTAKLIVSNRYGADTFTLTLTIAGCPPVAAFTIPDSICHSDCATITDSSYKNPTSWQWTFQGGTPSSYTGEILPLICYAVAGNYPIKLVVTNQYGSDSITKNLYVAKCLPQASFTIPDSICHTDCATVTNTSTNNPTSWQWTFQSGTPSTFSGENPPQVCYSVSGNYPIKLVVANQYGSDSITKNLYVAKCLPHASFTIPDSICHTDCATVTNTSTNYPTSWRWTFQGGAPSSYYGMSPPQVCYAVAGNYPIKIVVSNQYGSDSITQTLAVKKCLPHAFFNGTDIACRTQCISYIDSSVNATTWQWSFPGGNPSSYTGQNPPTICYNDTGNYMTQLITTNSYGADTFAQSIRVNDCFPYASFIFPDSICKTDCINATNSSSPYATSWQWTFNGGVPSSYNGPNPPAICYDTVGNFSVQLIAGNRYGTDTFQSKLTVIDCSPYVSLAPPDTICQYSCITPGGLTSSHITSLHWYFPGGKPSSFSGINPPAICYDTAGNYSVRLIALNAYGSDTLSVPGYITVEPLPLALISQNGDTLTCSPQIAYQWYFNNTIIAGATNRSFIAGEEGSYSVKVTALSGCYDYTTIFINGGLDINSVGMPGEITISPNPNGGLFQISGLIYQVSEIEVFNTLGQIILDTRNDAHDTMPISIDLSSRPAGVYFIKIQTENGKVVKKVVKE